VNGQENSCRGQVQVLKSNEENQEAAGHKTLTMAARNSQVSSGHRQSVVERVTGTGQPRTGTE